MRMKIVITVSVMGLVVTGCSDEGSAADAAPPVALLPHKVPKPPPRPEDESATAADATFSQNLEWELRRKTRAMAAAAGKVTAECPKDLGSKSGTEVSCTSTYSGLELTWDVHIGDASEWSDSVVQYTAVPRKGLLTRDGIVRYFYGNSSADEVRCNAIPEAVLVPLNQPTSYECQNVYKDKGPMLPEKVKATDSGPSQVF